MSEPITVEAVYENGVLKPVQPLPLKEGERVRVVIPVPSPDRAIPPAEPLTRDTRLSEWAAMDKELEYAETDAEYDEGEGR